MTIPNSPPRRPLITLDWWAVLLSLAIALLIKSGILRNIPW
jgi:hypothetical protein